MDPTTIIFLLFFTFIFLLFIYLACITFLPKSHKIKEINFSVYPPKIRFIFK
jgi:phage shock protein PspC (stress-responsive transcriptional regulator)